MAGDQPTERHKIDFRIFVKVHKVTTHHYIAQIKHYLPIAVVVILVQSVDIGDHEL